MDRRSFFGASGALGLASLGNMAALGADAPQGGRDFYHLYECQIDTEDQKRIVDKFLEKAAVPALNRLGIRPVGVFYLQEGLSPVYVLLRHKSLETLVTIIPKLMADEAFCREGAEFLGAPASAPAFKRVESSLMLAFKGMPDLERPTDSPERVLQLRTYESASYEAAQKKIEMFNDAGEIAIFRRTGLMPVFFSQTLVGTKMPCLTYMLAFKNMQEQKDNWKKFTSDPEWKRLRSMPEYADKQIVSHITNLLLKPAAYSQI